MLALLFIKRVILITEKGVIEGQALNINRIEKRSRSQNCNKKLQEKTKAQKIKNHLSKKFEAEMNRYFC